MASTKASGLKVAVKYVTNEPTPRTFAVAMKACYFTADAALFGAVAADPEDPQIPNELKMRKCKVTDATGLSRYVPIYNVTGTLWATIGTSVTLDKLGVDTVFVSQKEHRAEKLGRAGKSVPAAAG